MLWPFCFCCTYSPSVRAEQSSNGWNRFHVCFSSFVSPTKTQHNSNNLFIFRYSLWWLGYVRDATCVLFGARLLIRPIFGRFGFARVFLIVTLLNFFSTPTFVFGKALHVHFETFTQCAVRAVVRSVKTLFKTLISVYRLPVSQVLDVHFLFVSVLTPVRWLLFCFFGSRLFRI